MKLAEALILRKDFVKSLETIKHRFIQSAVVEEGTEPEHDPKQTLEALYGIVNAIRKLDVTINKLNNVTMVGDLTMMEALAARESLKRKAELINDLPAHTRASSRRPHYGQQTPGVKFVSLYDTKLLQIDVDRTHQQLRELDIKIQQVNWLTEVGEIL